MDSIHKLWALLKIVPPQWEFCHTWLLCLSSAWLQIGSAMYFCLSSLFCLVVLWITIWLSVFALLKSPAPLLVFASQESKRIYSEQSLGANWIALVNKWRSFILNDSCMLWKTLKYLIGKNYCVARQYGFWVFLCLHVWKNVHIGLIELFSR